MKDLIKTLLLFLYRNAYIDNTKRIAWWRPSEKLCRRVQGFLYEVDGFGADETGPEIDKILTELLDESERTCRGTLRWAAIRSMSSVILSRNL